MALSAWFWVLAATWPAVARWERNSGMAVAGARSAGWRLRCRGRMGGAAPSRPQVAGDRLPVRLPVRRDAGGRRWRRVQPGPGGGRGGRAWRRYVQKDMRRVNVAEPAERIRAGWWWVIGASGNVEVSGSPEEGLTPRRQEAEAPRGKRMKWGRGRWSVRGLHLPEAEGTGTGAPSQRQRKRVPRYFPWVNVRKTASRGDAETQRVVRG